MIGRFLSLLDLSGSPGERLARIAQAFRRIPYENLTKIIRFDERRHDALHGGDEILGGFLTYGAGGTCFSIVNALQETLAAAGIESRPLLADRNYGADTHCALVAEVDGRPWLLDPGYLIFEPIPFPDGQARAPGGSMHWTVRGDRVEAATVYPNGHRKIRYSLKPNPVSRDDFVGAWIKSYAFEMMRYPVVTRIRDDGRHVYLRDGHLMIDGRAQRTLDPGEIPGEVERLGIRPELARRALDILGKR